MLLDLCNNMIDISVDIQIGETECEVATVRQLSVAQLVLGQVVKGPIDLHNQAL